MNELDLHGVRHHEVDRLVENFILLNQNSLPLTIICGNSQKMVDLTLSVTRRLDCDIYEPRFGIIIVRRI
jgi:hypothetical protein